MLVRLLACVAIHAIVLSIGTAARASHTTFSYTASLFELSGSQGSFVDAFGNGVLSPWFNGAGTASDTGAGLLLSDPGTDVNVTSPFWSDTELRDVSSAFHPGLSLSDGGGDFLLESRWTSGAPLPNQLYGMGLQTDTKSYTLVLANWTSDLAAKATNPLAGGIYAWFIESTQLAPPPDLEISVNPDPLSTGHLLAVGDSFAGDVILRIAFGDAADLFEASFSVNSGSSYEESLSSYVGDTGWTSLNVNLVADPVQVVPEPNVAGLVGLGLIAFAIRRRRRGSDALDR